MWCVIVCGVCAGGGGVGVYQLTASLMDQPCSNPIRLRVRVRVSVLEGPALQNTSPAPLVRTTFSPPLITSPSLALRIHMAHPTCPVHTCTSPTLS